MGHVGLEAQRLRPVDHFQQFDHPPPTVHAAPADFAFGGQPLAVILGNVAGLAEGRRRSASGCRPDRPTTRPRRRPNRSARRRWAERPARAAARRCGTPLRPASRNRWRSFALAHRRAAAGRRPHRRHHRADLQISRAGLVGQRLDLVVAGVDIDVRREQKQVDAVELHAVDLGRGGQIEHRIQVDRRLAALSFADHARPGGVVELGIVVGMCVGHDGYLALCDGLRCSVAEWDLHAICLAACGTNGLAIGLGFVAESARQININSPTRCWRFSTSISAATCGRIPTSEGVDRVRGLHTIFEAHGSRVVHFSAANARGVRNTMTAKTPRNACCLHAWHANGRQFHPTHCLENGGHTRDRHGHRVLEYCDDNRDTSVLVVYGVPFRRFAKSPELPFPTPVYGRSREAVIGPAFTPCPYPHLFDCFAEFNSADEQVQFLPAAPDCDPARFAVRLPP